MITRPFAVRLAALLLLFISGEVRGAEPLVQPVQLHAKTRLVPASMAAAKAILVNDDRFTTRLSRFDLESRVGKLGATRAEFNALVQSSVLRWTPERWARITKAAETVAVWMKQQELAPPWPETVEVIVTNGKEEGGAAYCRGKSIVLPDSVVRNGSPDRLSQLLAHELFHILSSNHRPLQQRLYRSIGFRPCQEISLPAGLVDRKLTNPDGPGLNYTLELDAERTIVPLLFASVDRYDPEKGGPFFRYLKFKLLQVEPLEGGDGAVSAWRVKTMDGRGDKGDKGDNAVLLDPKSEPAFFAKVGRNTNYLYHPDEILADNFVFLLRGDNDLKSPDVVQRMRQILRDPPARAE